MHTSIVISGVCIGCGGWVHALMAHKEQVPVARISSITIITNYKVIAISQDCDNY